MYVCMLPTFLKNYWTELHEIFRHDCHHPRTNWLDFGSDQVKGQGPGHEKVKNIFLLKRAQFLPIHMKPTPKCSLFNSLSSDMVTNVALAKVCALLSSLYACMYVTNFSQKLLDQIAWNFPGWFFIIQGPLDQILGAIRSKVKVKFTKRSKTYLCHNSLSFRQIHIKPTPKGSLFISLSSDRSKVKVNVTKRSKTYFGHNTLSFCQIHMKSVLKCSLFNSLFSDRSKVKDQKHILVITHFPFSSNSYETNAKRFTFQFPILC